LGITKTISFRVSGEEVDEQIEELNNYPNPSNPITTIRFALKKPGPTTLIVYDMLGKEVARLIDREMPRGNHHVSFDASGLASGVYIYQLESRGAKRVNKLIIVR
jgi:hypothetical protein